MHNGAKYHFITPMSGSLADKQHMIRSVNHLLRNQFEALFRIIESLIKSAFSRGWDKIRFKYWYLQVSNANLKEIV